MMMDSSLLGFWKTREAASLLRKWSNNSSMISNPKYLASNPSWMRVPWGCTTCTFRYCLQCGIFEGWRSGEIVGDVEWIYLCFTHPSLYKSIYNIYQLKSRTRKIVRSHLRNNQPLYYKLYVWEFWKNVIFPPN